jgi:hypothetical protein
VKLAEIFFIASSKDDAKALSEVLDDLGYNPRIVSGDGSGTAWQVRANDPPVPDFPSRQEAERYIEETLQPLGLRFRSEFGGTLREGNAESGFAVSLLFPAD